MVAPKTKNEVAKADTKGTAVDSPLPDFMKGDAGKGTENLGSADMEIPRLVLLQSLSPEVVDGDFKAGTFYHTVLEETVGDGKELRIVPIYADIRYILWRPRHEGGGILARADDGVHWSPANAEFSVKPYKDQPKQVVWKTKDTVAESGLANWGSSDPSDTESQPAATKMWNFVVALPDYPELGPMVLTFQRGSAYVGKNFSGKLAMGGKGAPSFGQVFNMTVKKDNNGSGDFFNFVITKEGYVSDANQYLSYKEMYEHFKAMGVKIRDVEGAQDEGVSGGGNKADTPEGAIDV